jgi:hypothetical protein
LRSDIHIGATASYFSGLMWGMMPWDMAQSMKENEWTGETGVVRLLIHEGFHAIQDRVVHGEWLGSPPDYIDSYEDTRIGVLLELNALLAALRAEGDARTAAIHDALSIRADRQQRHPAQAINEFTIEISEGLAVFTEVMLTINSLDEKIEFFAGPVSGMNDAPMSLFGYQSGGMYALLLELVGADWKQGLTYGTNLAALLQQALGITELTPFNQLNLEQYGYSQIASTQRAWIENRQRLMAEAEEALDRQPTLTLMGDYVMNWGLGGSFYISNDGMGRTRLVAYGHHTITGTNYQLKMQGAYMLYLWNPRGVRIGAAVNVEIDENGSRAAAPTWVLEITDDRYMIRQADNGNISVGRR